MPKPVYKKTSAIKTSSMADVGKVVKKVSYLVDGWIPNGMVTMFIAEPGGAKSAGVLGAIVKPVVTGTPFFDGKPRTKKSQYVLWCDTESTAAINFKRMNDWGIPSDKVLVPHEDPLQPFDLTSANDLQRLKDIIEQHDVKVVVIDSLRGAHNGDENSSSMQTALKTLSTIAESTGVAIIAIHHTRKMYEDEELTAGSSRGSNAFVAVSRSVLGIDRPNKNSDWRRLQMLKENLGIAPAPIGFRVTNTGIEFGPAPQRAGKAVKQVVSATEFLKESLADGEWKLAAEIIENAKVNHALSVDVLKRARNDLGIVTPHNVRKTKDGWEWRFPLLDLPGGEEGGETEG